MDTPTGTTQLPSARIRKLIALDPDIATISADALFVISIATELFVKEMVMLARKQAMDQGRKGIHYKDMAATVAEITELEFLKDIVPQMVPLSHAMKMAKDGPKLAMDAVPMVTASALDDDTAKSEKMDGHAVAQHPPPQDANMENDVT